MYLFPQCLAVNDSKWKNSRSIYIDIVVKVQETSLDTGIHYLYVPLLYMNSECVLECRDTSTSHCVNCNNFDPYIRPFTIV